MSTVLSTLEQYFQAASEKILETLSEIYGVEYEVYGVDVKDPYTVYGPEPAESDYVLRFSGKGILTPVYGFVDYSPEHAGEMEEAYLYTTDSEIEPGDVVKVVRTDGASKRFRVYAKEVMGITCPVLFKYRVRPLVD